MEHPGDLNHFKTLCLSVASVWFLVILLLQQASRFPRAFLPPYSQSAVNSELFYHLNFETDINFNSVIFCSAAAVINIGQKQPGKEKLMAFYHYTPSPREAREEAHT